MMNQREITLGDSGDSVRQLSASLTKLGLLPGESEIFNEEVARAVRELQQSRGLKVTGSCDEKTLRAIDEAGWKLGDRVISLTSPMLRGDDVATLQKRLSSLGFDLGKADGIFGAKSEAGLIEFQKSVGIAPSGQCGPETVIALMRLIRTVSGGASHALREDALRSRRGPSLQGKIIVIDPSWGGSNPGHSFGTVKESEFTYDLAQRLAKRLVELEVSAHLTRDEVSSPSESERIEFTNSLGADLLISLHCDNYHNEKAEGVASYYYGSEVHGIKSLVGERFATLVQREISARTTALNCRTHAKSWDLLRLTKAPSVRIDIGYLSHPGDRERISSNEFRESVVEALIVAIQRLYLSAESDAKTGTLRIEDLRQAGARQ
jgi:N-acetylmuramoyl-L-alanine amidase